MILRNHLWVVLNMGWYVTLVEGWKCFSIREWLEMLTGIRDSRHPAMHKRVLHNGDLSSPNASIVPTKKYWCNSPLWTWSLERWSDLLKDTQLGLEPRFSSSYCTSLSVNKFSIEKHGRTKNQSNMNIQNIIKTLAMH